MLLEHIDRKWLPLGERWLGINEQSGAWLVVDENCRNLIPVLESSSSIEAVLEAFPDTDLETVIELLKACSENKRWIRETSKRTCSVGQDEPAPVLAVVKVAEGCNLNCSYCFIDASVDKTRKMTVETARRIFDELVHMHEDDDLLLNYCFHGGEPLLNMDVIRDIAEYSAPYRNRLMLSVQTNATLITDEMAAYFNNNGINVGISIDGPEELHNFTRHYKNGRGSFDHTLRGIKILQKHDMPFGIITVLSEENARHMNEMLDFFIANGIFRLSFSFLMKIGRGKDESNNTTADGGILIDAYKILLDRVLSHNKTHPKEEWLHERNLTNMVRSIYFNERPFMCMNAPCGAARKILGFDTEGNYYACDTFINDKDFLIGSLENGEIMENLLGSKVRQQSMARCMENLERCRNCTWRGLCGGLCYSADYYSGALGKHETEVCALYKYLIPYLIQRIDDEPQLPYLIDPEIDKKPKRNIYISLNRDTGLEPGEDRIDRELLDLLLKFHAVECSDYESVYLCVNQPGEVPDLARIFTLLRSKSIEYYVVPKQKFIDALNVDLFRTLSESGAQALQIRLPDFNHPLETAKKLFDLRQSAEKKIPFVFLIPADSDLWINDFARLVQDKFLEEDFIVLSLPAVEEEPDRRINTLLEKIRQNGLSDHIVLDDIPAEILWKNNKAFLARQKEKDQEYLLIESSCLGGKILEAPLIQGLKK